MSNPLKIFITYAHKNKEAKDTLIECLAVMEDAGEIEIWDDNKILPGDEWEKAISDNLAESDVLLYLTSAPSLASKNCNKELAEALSASIRVIPIILEACDWENHQLSRFEALPHKGKPTNKWQLESDGWQNVVEGVRKVVEEMQTNVQAGTLPEWVFQQGNFLMMLGQIDKAIAAYSHAIKLNPNYIYAYSNRGLAYIAKREVDRAIEDFNVAINLNPNESGIYSNRGLAYLNKDEVDHAIEDYTKAIKLEPNDAGVYYNRGNVYRKKGDPNRAITDLNKAIQLKPNFVEAYTNRGIAYSDRDDTDRAIEDYTKAIELKSNYAEAYVNRGSAYTEKGDFDRAIADLNKAIQLKPNFVEAYYNRGAVYSDRDDTEYAIEDYTKAIELKPDFAEAYYNLGIACGKKGDTDNAIENFTKTIQLKPEDADGYHNRGVAYAKKGDSERAIVDFNKAIELNPHGADAYNNRGLAYGEKGDFDHAIVDFSKTIELNLNYAEAYINRGSAYTEKGDFDRAIDDFNSAIALNSNHAHTYHNRGLAYGKKGDYDRAIDDFNKAILRKPDYTDAYNNRGLAYGKKGDYDRAIDDYSKVIELNPNDADAYNNRGVAFYKLSDTKCAISDYTKVIDLKPDAAIAYSNRGEAWLHLAEWDKARADLTNARDLGVDIVASFHNDYENVEAYERANRVKLPEDIAAMLTQQRRSRFPRTEKFLNSDGTPFESPDVLKLFTKLRNAGIPLLQYVQTRPTFGLKIGRGEAFVVDSVTRDLLIADHPASADILKPFLHGRDIRRWGVARSDAWLIFAYRRIEINRYPAIRKHLEKYRSALSKRTGKQKWYELPATKSDAERFTQTKLICPNRYDHQTFAVDTEGFYCGDTCYLIPTEETWLCGLLNSRVVEWFYSQTSNQLSGDYLQARSRHIQEIPIPDLTSTQKSLIGKIVDYLIFLQGQPTTSGKDLAHARDFIMLGYFERIIDGLVYESYLREELHQGEKQFFKPLFDERLPQLEEMPDDKMSALQEIFERLYERTHPIRRNLFFLDSVKPIRIIEGKA